MITGIKFIQILLWYVLVLILMCVIMFFVQYNSARNVSTDYIKSYIHLA